MKQKLGVTVIWIGLLFFYACNCEEVQFPYYDFSTIEFSYNSSTDMNMGDTLQLALIDGERIYLASSFKMFPSAMATQPCPRDGHLGRKFALTSMEITSDTDFDAAHPAGTSLIDLFSYGQYNVDTKGYDFLPLTNSILPQEYFSLGLLSSPDSMKIHHFTFTYTKENGTTAVGTTESYTWQ